MKIYSYSLRTFGGRRICIGFFLGWWQEHVYRRTIAANVYTPDQYAAGWELVR